MSSAFLQQPQTFLNVDEILYQNRKALGLRSQTLNQPPSMAGPRLISGGHSHLPSPFQQDDNQQINNSRNLLLHQTNNLSSLPSTPERPVSPHAMFQAFSSASSASSHGNSPVLGQRDLIRRNLERSMSEPVQNATDRAGSPTSSTSSNSSRNGTNANSNINSARYKTELCRPYEENGYCKYGEKCQFAHGLSELRTMSRHPKYKTELCRTYHTIGFCPYGPRCHFIHNEDERRMNAPNSPSSAMRPQGQQIPVNMTRAKQLNFNLPLPLGLRESLGSTADSPPASFTDSPTMSPTFGLEDLALLQASMSQVPKTAPPTLLPNSAFNFPSSSSSECQRGLNAQDIATMASLQQALTNNNNTSLHNFNHPNKNTTNNTSSMITPNELALHLENLDLFSKQQQLPSPPDSCDSFPVFVSSSHNDQVPTTTSCSSPLEVSRNLRLPIFSQLSLPEA